jgi:phenylacetate-CoA ligase
MRQPQEKSMKTREEGRNIVAEIRRKLVLLERRKTLKILTTSAPEQLVAYGERQLLKAFQRAALRVPAYKEMLKNAGCLPEQVTSIAAFKRLVPLIAKEDVFPHYSIKEVCLDGSISRIRSAMSSSGFSGIFSFGINTDENHRNAVKAIDTALDYIFHTSRKKTLFINSLPMGVRVPTSLPVADTSVRWDMALAIFRKFSPEFDQIIILSDPHFLKKILEEGIEQGIDWKRENVHLITGEDWMPETFRSYLGSLLGTDWERMDRGVIGGTMGVAELDLNLFHESQDTIRIQRAALADQRLRYALYGQGCEVQPTLFHYYPHRTFLEIVASGDGSPELVVSMLSDALLIPLMRYNVNDVAQLYSYNELKTILHDCGYGHLCPELKLPLIAVGGRNNRALVIDNASLAPEAVKQGIYANFSAAALTTGYFRISVQESGFLIEIQLRRGIASSPLHERALRDAIEKFVPVAFRLQAYPYQSFPYSMELDYERKFKNS